MSSCNLTKFPYFLNSLERLIRLDLSFNKISGEIPKWFWEISHHSLKNLDLSNNLLEGGIHQLHRKQLLYIDLQNNSFQGPLPIPSPSTRYFYANDNGFTDEIPSSICQLSSLLRLDLSNNNLSGIMPLCFGNMTKLLDLDLSNNSLFGNIPPYFGNITNLEHLNLSNNKLQGPLPRSLVKCANLSVLVLSHNEFNDIFPHWLEAPRLYYLDLQSNKFHGRINLTAFELSFPALSSLLISNNNFTGWWSTKVFSNTSLDVIDLSNNKFGGPIPQSFSSKNSLSTLNLSRNRFEGTLPRSLVKCIYLEILDLSSNHLGDAFPRWLGKLPELKVLILRSNNFEGLLNIPKGDLIFSKLRILDLSNNNFGGPLPANLIMNLEGMMDREDGQYEPLYMPQHSYMGSYKNTVTVMMKGRETELVKILTIFTTIDLSHNSFQGNIPGVIGHLHSLIGLNLSHNHLTGSIPLTLGNLTDLGWLDLSSNKLNGVIPGNLGDLASLGYLNLSKNQLTGRIPQDKQLSTFSSDSFSGNLGLCGTPLPKSCPGDAQPPPPSSLSTFDLEVHESWFKHKVVWLGYASGIVIGISIAYIAFEMGRPEWLVQVRMLEGRVGEWMEKSKRKAIKFHGQ
ncbi:receptor like protein 27-like [Syzygium oleosum]|uniref:receptor like protein 27-like n=1 Tax=Syzygium oleosum TaxID=219896 RepID=UPI0024BA8288|nr:receptor like protein 27-like [Syzygium oleosum]